MILDEHVLHLTETLATMKEHQLYDKRSKCAFAQYQVEYLGPVVTGEGVAMDKERVACMMSWAAPQTIKTLRGFMGLTEYYRKFVRGYGWIAKPLTNLLKKGQNKWNPESNNAFENLKQAMASAPLFR